jgi:RNA recognition motif. (a.k.a. RRM, RBD, or RNP domain)
LYNPLSDVSIRELRVRLGQSEDTILRRTVFVGDLPMNVFKEDIELPLEQFGPIAKLALDMTAAGKFVLVEFRDEAGAEEAIMSGQFCINGTRHHITKALRTAVGYTPHDVVFGKPMAIGRHVMAVNPTLVTSALISKREQSLKSVNYEVQRTLARISTFLPGLN